MHSIVVVSPGGMYAPKQVYWGFPVISKNYITFAPSIRIDSTVQNRDVRYANVIHPCKTVSALLANTSYPKDALVSLSSLILVSCKIAKSTFINCRALRALSKFPCRPLRILYVAMRIRRHSFSSRRFSLSIVFLSPLSFVEAD
jgi:hypothetical protein